MFDPSDDPLRAVQYDEAADVERQVQRLHDELDRSDDFTPAASVTSLSEWKARRWSRTHPWYAGPGTAA